ncbi:MAG: CBS domain-containing protein [Candidatus Micrarchaeota archaeon]|nr:CBS domain-containing protein [Candidatus Micrarchaeota archaeon]MDE1848135.1 CBS domain-containing protein [Candidatus Micrarchaeota archaeon]MDE1864790.1 CBS domain-containing protein [Candidatus Micrarchaeota archaeon]
MVDVGSVMQTHMVAVARSAKLDAVLKLMERSGVRIVPIIYGGRLIGAISKGDIQRAVQKGRDPAATQIDRIMPHNLYFIEAGSSIEDAAKIMIRHRLARLPVVNNLEDMLCVGVISSTEILRAKGRK